MKKTIVLLMLMTVIASVGLTACSGAADQEATNSQVAAQEQSTLNGVSEPTVTVRYADGTYKADGGYTAPSGEEKIAVSVTLKDEVVTGLTVNGDSQNPATKQYMGKFIEGINTLVVGKKLSEIGSFSAVNGASLTPKGFEVALNSIKTQAKYY